MITMQAIFVIQRHYRILKARRKHIEEKFKQEDPDMEKRIKVAQ